MATHILPAEDTMAHRPTQDCPCQPVRKRRVEICATVVTVHRGQAERERDGKPAARR